MDQKEKRPTENWTEIKKAYEDRSQTVKQICEHYNLKRSELYQTARDYGWPLRSEKQNKATKTNSKRKLVNQPRIKHPAKDGPLTNPTETLQDALEFITMDLMQRIQKRTKENDTDHDKDARTLSSLVRTYEKLKQMKSSLSPLTEKGEQLHSPLKQTPNTQAPNIQVPDTQTNEDAKRREIAASLEKLIQGL